MTDGYGYDSHPSLKLMQACEMLADKDSRIMELEMELQEKNEMISRLVTSLVLALIFIGILIVCTCVG